MNEYPMSLLEWSYEQIKQKLFSGELKPGEKLVVSKLAKDLDVSPTPIKEALNRLVAEGVLEALPRRGFQVKRLTIEEIQDVMRCRLMMETYAVDGAIENYKENPDISKKMREILRSLNKIGNKNYYEAATLEYEFHSQIIELSGNKKLMELYNIMWGVGFSFYIYSYLDYPMICHVKAVEEHEKMVTYLENGMNRELKGIITKHLEETIDLYNKILEEKKDKLKEEIAFMEE